MVQRAKSSKPKSVQRSRASIIKLAMRKATKRKQPVINEKMKAAQYTKGKSGNPSGVKKDGTHNNGGQMLMRAHDIRAAMQAGDVTPLQYALKVLNDPDATDTDRKWAATVALPYVHSRMPVKTFETAPSILGLSAETLRALPTAKLEEIMAMFRGLRAAISDAVSNAAINREDDALASAALKSTAHAPRTIDVTPT